MTGEELFPFLFIPFFLAMILELIFSLAWVQFYYRNGIPLVKKSCRIPLMFDLTPHVGTLQSSLKRGFFRPAITIKPFSQNEFGFRNTFTSRSQVNGMIRVEPSNGRLTITGHLYWAFIIMILFGALTSIVVAQPFVFIGFLFIAGLSIFFQWLITKAVINSIHETLKKEGLIVDDPFASN